MKTGILPVRIWLRALFSTSRAIGLCLYDRTRTPLDVVNGALCTHPMMYSAGGYRANPFYDAETKRLTPADKNVATTRLATLARLEPAGDA